MKNIILIISIIAVSLVACRKYRWFRPIEWKYIQGTWSMKQCLINNIDSTAIIKNSNCYFDYYIGYSVPPNNPNKVFHLYADPTSLDFGVTNVEANNYKKITIDGCNLNSWINRGNSCANSLTGDYQIDWSIDVLTSSELDISTTFNGKSYTAKYEKK